MSVLDSDRVDAVSVHSESEECFLSIFDHLEWGDETDSHLGALQEKINTYLAVIESGQIQDEHPEIDMSKVCIEVVGKFPLTKEAEVFYSRASLFLKNVGVRLYFRLSDSSCLGGG